MVQSAKITEPTKLSTRLMVALVATILSNTFLLGAIESKRKMMLHFDKIEVKGALRFLLNPGIETVKLNISRVRKSLIQSKRGY